MLEQLTHKDNSLAATLSEIHIYLVAFRLGLGVLLL